jgi:hypothetical protein
MTIERPIIMSAESVRAILSGRKTQTRCVIKPQPNIPVSGHPASQSELLRDWMRNHPCPYKVGMTLWVRETWRIVGWSEGEPYWIEYKSDGACLEEPGDSQEYDDDKYIQYWIESSDDCDEAKIPTDENGIYIFGENEKIPTRWRSPIYMPRWASRITLEITGARAERLQDITDTGGMYEGWICDPNDLDYLPRQWYRELWDSINARRGFPWDSNPWCWCVIFKMLKGETE